MRPRMLRTSLATLTTSLAAAGCLIAAGPAVAQERPQRNACSPAVSLTGYSDALDKTTHDGTYVGNLSALARDGRARSPLSPTGPPSSGWTPAPSGHGT